MRNFDADILTEINRENFRFFFLLELIFTTTWRFNDIDINIYRGSDLFVPRAFTFGSLTGSANFSVESLDIDIDDTDQAMSGVLNGEDVRNKIAIIYFGTIALDTYEFVIQEFTRGIVGGWELFDDNKSRINLTCETILWNKKSLRPQSSSCPWAFTMTGATECGYVIPAEFGGDWCDQSYERCVALGNQAHFGGDRFLPSIVEKEVWWGRQRQA